MHLNVKILSFIWAWDRESCNWSISVVFWPLVYTRDKVHTYNAYAYFESVPFAVFCQAKMHGIHFSKRIYELYVWKIIFAYCLWYKPVVIVWVMDYVQITLSTMRTIQVYLRQSPPPILLTLWRMGPTSGRRRRILRFPARDASGGANHKRQNSWASVLCGRRVTPAPPCVARPSAILRFVRQQRCVHEKIVGCAIIASNSVGLLFQ